MVTLDRWREFAATPKALVFPRLELIGRDHAPPIVTGAGEIRMDTPSQFAFTLSGTPTDIGYALRELNRHRDNPYDAQARPRLIGIDAAGIRWSGGYTIPHVTTRSSGWTFGGEIESLLTNEQSAAVSLQAGTELIFLLRINDPMVFHLARYARDDRPAGESRREKVMEILGSTVHFVYEDSRSTLLITASHSPAFPALYAENWLGEPLRILFGQLIYPRIVARNFGDGRAQVSVRRSPGIIRGARWVALWGEDDLTQDNSAFWSTYTRLLTLIARARGKDGSPNFESNKITRLYEECIQAARGSRWVWALTFASSIEALVKMLIPKELIPAQAKADEIEAKAHASNIAALVEHINLWSGDNRLKQIAISAAHRSAEITTIRALRNLKAHGVITAAQISAWETMRHAVMHGSLVSSYSTKEEDEQLLALAAMLHALTRELLRRSAAG